jgi:Polysaccharide biosynthesis protein C-terminal.
LSPCGQHRSGHRGGEEFNSDNTYRLNLEETKAKIASLEYIQNELNGIPNIVK